jgi:hypothetical protein
MGEDPTPSTGVSIGLAPLSALLITLFIIVKPSMVVLNEFFNRRQNFRSLFTVELLLETLQSQADNITVVQLRTHVVLRGEA